MGSRNDTEMLGLAQVLSLLSSPTSSSRLNTLLLPCYYQLKPGRITMQSGTRSDELRARTLDSYLHVNIPSSLSHNSIKVAKAKVTADI